MTSPSKTTTVNTSEPWDEAKPYYEQLYAKTMTALNQTNQQPFTGEFVAGPTTAQQQGAQSLITAAPGLGTGVDAIRGLAGDTISGNYLNPESNPYLSGAIDAAIRPVTENFQNVVLPGLTDAAISGGAYGGARHFLTGQGLASDYERNIGDIATNMAYGNYAAERDRQMAAPSLFGQANELAQAPGTTLLAAGSQQQDWLQSAIDNAYQKFLEQQKAPWYGLGEAAQILGTGGFSTTSGSTTGSTNILGQLLKGLLGGLSFFS
jgi:hypothetical protein